MPGNIFKLQKYKNGRSFALEFLAKWFLLSEYPDGIFRSGLDGGNPSQWVLDAARAMALDIFG
jgi:hypothetical protein